MIGLREIATEHRRGAGPRLRVDLLSQTAGTALGRGRDNAAAGWLGPAIADLLMAAGADPEQVERVAAETVEYLAGYRARRGSGSA